MEQERFDAIIRTLGNRASRRGALGLLAGFAGLGLGEATAKQHKAKTAAKRRKGNGKGRRRVQSASADKPGKIDVCHFDADTETWTAITVSKSGWTNGHAKHERDFLRGDCCTDADCRPGQACRPGSSEAASACVDQCVADLAAALSTAEDGDTIRLCPGEHKTVNQVIAKDVTVVGAGSGDDPGTNTILKSDGSGRVLTIPAGAEVELRDLKVTGGRATGAFPAFNGGGIVNQGALRLVGVEVSDNVAQNVGGGIHQFSSGATLTMRNSTVRRNTARYGAGMFTSEPTTLEAGSIVEENRALGTDGSGGGGGIWNGSTDLKLKDGSVVRTNFSANQGGGIYNASGGPATVRTTLEPGSRVTGNTADVAGGGVFTQSFLSVTVIEDGAILTDNRPDDCEPNIGTCT